MGESIAEAVILRWIKSDGDRVAVDEPLCELETDKATFDLPSPVAGSLKTLKDVGATVKVGEVVARIEEGAVAPAAKPAASQPPASKTPTAEETPPRPARPEPTPPAPPPPAVPRKAAREAAPVAVAPPKPAPAKPVAAEEGNGVHRASKPAVDAVPASAPASARLPAKSASGGSRREPMSKIRRRIAERLVRAQHTAAMLTTFNEIDMTAVLDLRERNKQEFEKLHGVSLGLMSFFSRACVLALRQFPAINAEIEGNDIIYHDHVHLGIAVNTERGLVVPVLRNVQDLSFAQIESEIKRVATAARDGKLSLQELSGGTFTITNGGVFGSLLSTPILNPPQTGILGMHTIQKRPVVVNDKIRARRMMYVALSYDHRLVDGRDAVSFLVKLKKLLEDPMTMLLEG
jgi:2-oxoglutarate dehydrogenase E2 component (dihydrolipoamide succinyltransferase)